MSLKWTAVITAAVAITACVTFNIVFLVVTDKLPPEPANALGIAVSAVALVLAVVAALYERLYQRLNVIEAELTGRIDELVERVGDHNTGFVDGFLAGNGNEAPARPSPIRGTLRAVPREE